MKIDRLRKLAYSAVLGMLLPWSIFSAHSAVVLEEIVVTAQKRSESVQDIPVAVTGISSDEITQLGFANPNDISAQVPNMQVSGPYGKAQPIFSIRGISMSDYNSNQASPVGAYLDEAYMPATYTHGLNFFDMERIEVLRGPQGTLYGRNTTGGAVNLITNTPTLNGETRGYLTLGVGNYSKRATEGAYETALIDGKLAARVAFSYDKDDGYYENKAGGPDMAQTDFKAFRLGLNWQMTDRLNAVIKYTAGESTPRASVPRNEGRIPVGGGVNLDVTGYQRPASFDFHEGEFNRVGDYRTESDQATLRLSYDGDNYSIVSVTGWNDAEFLNEADIDGHGAPDNLDIDYSGDSKSIGQDLRFVSDFDGPINFIAGVYYGREENAMGNLFTAYNPFFNLLLLSPDPDLAATGVLLTEFGVVDQRFESTKETKAAYGQLRWELTERLGLDIGLRYTEDETELDYLNISRLDYDGTPLGSWTPGNISQSAGWIIPGLEIDNAFFPPGILGPGDPGFYLDGPYSLASIPTFSEVEREWSGKVGLDYAFTEELMAYASYSRGFRSGSINGGVHYVVRPVEKTYAAPEFVDAYEIGFKGDFLGGLLRVNGAAFYYDYTDQQFVNVVGVSVFIENAGGSDVYGAELELWALPTDNLSLRMSVGALDTEFTELKLADSSTPDPGDQIDLKGNELISAPELNLSFAGDYRIPMGWGGIVHLHADANYQASQWYSAYNDAIGYGEIQQDSYWLYNARVSMIFGAKENYRISAWGKNLSDEEYDSYAINLQAGFGYDYYLSGGPRTYGVEFNYQF